MTVKSQILIKVKYMNHRIPCRSHFTAIWLALAIITKCMYANTWVYIYRIVVQLHTSVIEYMCIAKW